MRKLLSRIVAGLAGFVYQRGVDLYRLSDWLDGTTDETGLTEPELAAMWSVSEPVTTSNSIGDVKIIWNKSA